MSKWLKARGKYPKDWEKIKDEVIDRANYKCEICKRKPKFDSIYGSQKIIIHLQNFRVHHKDQDKSNNNLDNLIFVCKNCHGQLHRELNNG